MKKTIALILAALMALSLVACGGNAPEAPTETTVETPVATPETNEPNVEIPLPAWIEKREDGFCYLLPDAIEGIDDIIKPSVMFYYYKDYATTSHIPTQYVPFSSLTQMQDVLLYSLPTYYYKWHLGNLQGGDYKLGFDPRNLMAPVIPSTLEYERVEVTASAGGYNICWMSKDEVYWDTPPYCGFLNMECFSSEHLASLGYDDYYEDVFMKGRGKHVGTEKIENGIVADVYSYGNGETILSYSVNENYHVIEDPTENRVEVLIETDDYIIWYFYNCYFTKIPTSLTREELWSFGVKPFVPAEDTTNRDLSDTLVRIHEG